MDGEPDYSSSSWWNYHADGYQLSGLSETDSDGDGSVDSSTLRSYSHIELDNGLDYLISHYYPDS